MGLTVIQVKSLQPADKAYKLFDGHGLYIHVQPNGKKYWRAKCIFNKKEKTLSFGVFPEVTLAEAREKHREARAKIREGVDPNQTKKAIQVSPLIFESLYIEWIAQKKNELTNGRLKQIESIFNRYVLPSIGRMLITNITPIILLGVIKKVEARGFLTISREVRGRVSDVFTLAIVTGRLNSNPCYGLEKVTLKHKSDNNAFLLESDIAQFIHALNNAKLSPIALSATKIAMYTGLRTQEILQATWSEINMEKKVWEIPSERMKMRKSHIVPLSTEVIELLKCVPVLNTTYVFSYGKTPVGPKTIINAIKKAGYAKKMTGHGFRHTMSTILHDHDFDSKLIELQLSHADNTVRGVYNHAKQLDKRREMLQWYADHLGELVKQLSLPPQLFQA